MPFRHSDGGTFTRYKNQFSDINHTIYLTSLTPQQPCSNDHEAAPCEDGRNKNAPQSGNADQLRIH
jgi:hypothetical protein